MNNKLSPLFMCILSFTSLFVSAQTDKVKVNTQGTLTILFVCEHGAGRSAIAASYFNKSAQKKGINYKAIFRGVDPQEALGTSTRIGLVKDSVDVTNLIPTKLSKNDIHTAYKVITLDCNLPDTFTRPDMHWTGIPMNGNYEASRNKITEKVDSLIAIISKAQKWR